MKLSRNRKAVVTRPFMWGPIGFAVARASHPVLNDLIQWLYALPSTDDGLPDNSGLSNDALRVDSACVGFNGLDQYGSANNTGLGAGDFYYLVAFEVGNTLNGEYIFCDGGGFIGGKRLGVFVQSIGTQLSLNIDDNVTNTNIKLFCPYSATDALVLLIERVGSSVTFSCTNLTTDTTHSVSATNTQDFSSSDILVLGGIYRKDIAVVDLHSNITAYKFVAGTSAENITESFHLAGLSGPTCENTANPSNPMMLEAGSGSLEVMRSYRQDVYHANWDNGGSKVLESDSAFVITAPHLVGTETVVNSVGTATPTVSAGQINCTAGYLSQIELSDGTVYKLFNAYNNGTTLTITDEVNDNDATALTTLEVFYPKGSEVSTLLGDTNVADGRTNPNCETKVLQFDTAPDASELLKNSLDNPNGTGFEAVSYGDEMDWVSGYDNVWIRKYTDDNGLTRTERLTYLFDKEWTLPEFNRQLRYLGITADDTNALLDVNGNPELVSGYVVFTS